MKDHDNATARLEVIKKFSAGTRKPIKCTLVYILEQGEEGRQREGERKRQAQERVREAQRKKER